MAAKFGVVVEKGRDTLSMLALLVTQTLAIFMMI